MELSSDRRTVHQCLEQKYSLPTYQREYKWETKHFQELLQDIQEAFFANYQSDHGRSAVAKYEKYFLGTIITTPSANGERTIVDGQQRITTLALIVAYFFRLAKEQPKIAISDIASLLRRNVFGQTEFNITFDPPRRHLFELLIDYYPGDSGTSETLDEKIDSIANLDDGSRRLYDLFSHAHNCISKLDQDQIPYFVDYLTQCVVLFEISVPGEQDGHKVFVTMNDRGLKLSPIDLLKGYLLSNIPDDAENIAAHKAWKGCLEKLRAVGSDEDSTFFKTWLRAQYATSSRGKQKGAAPGDFEIIGDAYHRWVVDNRALLGLSTSDDFSKLLTRTLPAYVDHYVQIKNAENSFSISFPNVFYNGARDLTLQSMLMLSAISPEDTASEVSKKFRLVSYFLDCLATHRLVNLQDNTYNNLRDPLFEITKQVRKKSPQELATVLKKELDVIAGSQLVSLSQVSYSTHDISDVLHVLGRVASYLETEFEATNKVGFENYVLRGKSNKTFDIEHILPVNVAETKSELGTAYDFASDLEYTKKRNSIGGLILLSRGRNRSLKAATYKVKLPIYATESILPQTLSASFYGNNPQVTDKINKLNLPLTEISAFNSKSIDDRSRFYDAVAGIIWNPNELTSMAS